MGSSLDRTVAGLRLPLFYRIRWSEGHDGEERVTFHGFHEKRRRSE
jgi:hypothetical protein